MLANQNSTRGLLALTIAAASAGCGRSGTRSDSAAASGGDVATRQTPSIVRGVVSTITTDSLVVKTDTGSATIVIKETSKQLTAGDQIIVVSKRAGNGALAANSVLLVSK